MPDFVSSDNADDVLALVTAQLGGKVVDELIWRTPEPRPQPENDVGIPHLPPNEPEAIPAEIADTQYQTAQPDAIKASERQTQYMRHAADTHRALRQDRIKHLQARRSAIERAMTEYKRLREPERFWITIRSEFIWSESERARHQDDAPVDEDVRTRPALTRILHERNPHALALYLTGLYVTQMLAERYHRTEGGRQQTFVPTSRPNVFGTAGDASWVALSGLAQDGVKPADRRRRLTRALDALDRNGLVTLTAAHQRYRGFVWNREDGIDVPYTDPVLVKGRARGLYLPAEFFTSGWHLVLTPSELTTYLVIGHMTDRAQHLVSGERRRGAIFLPESVRWSRFGLSSEAYESIHELEEFGLIRISDPMRNRRRGRLRPPTTVVDRVSEHMTPYRLLETTSHGMPSEEMMFDLRRFERPAIEVVLERLSRYSVPRRFR